MLHILPVSYTHLELINLKFKHILEREGNYYIKLEETKSGREQYKSVHDILIKKLKEYKEYLQSLYDIDDVKIEEQYVFSSSVEKNTQLSYRALYDLVQNMGKLIGKDISCLLYTSTYRFQKASLTISSTFL